MVEGCTRRIGSKHTNWNAKSTLDKNIYAIIARNTTIFYFKYGQFFTEPGITRQHFHDNNKIEWNQAIGKKWLMCKVSVLLKFQGLWYIFEL